MADTTESPREIAEATVKHYERKWAGLVIVEPEYVMARALLEIDRYDKELQRVVSDCRGVMTTDVFRAISNLHHVVVGGRRRHDD